MSTRLKEQKESLVIDNKAKLMTQREERLKDLIQKLMDTGSSTNTSKAPRTFTT